MKKLRVLVLMHEDLVPPKSLKGLTDKEILNDALTKESKAAEWKVAKGKWERAADGIHVEELPADNHGAAGRVPMKPHSRPPPSASHSSGAPAARASGVRQPRATERRCAAGHSALRTRA